MPPGISAVPPDDLAGWFAARGEPAYRARQVGDAVWGHRARSFDDVQTLPPTLRSQLAEAFRFDTILRTEMRIADRGQTEKNLHELGDGVLIESVLMRYPGGPGRRPRATLCVSSQAGCAVGCPFCAT